MCKSLFLLGAASLFLVAMAAAGRGDAAEAVSPSPHGTGEEAAPPSAWPDANEPDEPDGAFADADPDAALRADLEDTFRSVVHAIAKHDEASLLALSTPALHRTWARLLAMERTDAEEENLPPADLFTILSEELAEWGFVMDPRRVAIRRMIHVDTAEVRAWRQRQAERLRALEASAKPNPPTDAPPVEDGAGDGGVGGSIKNGGIPRAARAPSIRPSGATDAAVRASSPSWQGSPPVPALRMAGDGDAARAVLVYLDRLRNDAAGDLPIPDLLPSPPLRDGAGATMSPSPDAKEARDGTPWRIFHWLRFVERPDKAGWMFDGGAWTDRPGDWLAGDNAYLEEAELRAQLRLPPLPPPDPLSVPSASGPPPR